MFCVALEINECKSVESRKSSGRNTSEFEDQRDQMQLDMEIFSNITQSTYFIVLFHFPYSFFFSLNYVHFGSESI